MIKNCLFFLILLTFVACLPDEPTFENFRRDELRYLLSNRSEKAWLVNERIEDNESVSLQECDSTRQLIFKFTAIATDTDSLIYVNRDAQCADSTTVQVGFWYIPANTTPPSVTDTLVFVWEPDTVYYRINEITPTSLQIEKFSRSEPLLETFILADSVD